MIILEKTATPLHTMKDSEVWSMMNTWIMELNEQERAGDDEGIRQATGFFRAYNGECVRRFRFC